MTVIRGASEGDRKEILQSVKDQIEVILEEALVLSSCDVSYNYRATPRQRTVLSA